MEAGEIEAREIELKVWEMVKAREVEVEAKEVEIDLREQKEVTDKGVHKGDRAAGHQSPVLLVKLMRKLMSEVDQEEEDLIETDLTTMMVLILMKL